MAKIKNSFRVSGFFKNFRVFDQAFDAIYGVNRFIYGNKLDELQLNLTLRSKSDIRFAIKLLETALPCFDTPENKHKRQMGLIDPGLCSHPKNSIIEDHNGVIHCGICNTPL